MLSNARDQEREKAEETLDQGIELLEQGDEEEAGRFFFQSIEIDPSYADGYSHLGNIAWRKGDWERAESLYHKALELAEPEVTNVPRDSFWSIIGSRPYVRAMHGLGLTTWKLDKYEEALDIFNRMLKLNPDDDQGVRYLIGPLYHEMRNLPAAIRWYEKNKNDPHNLYNYGLALIQQGRAEKAAQILILAIFTNPPIAPMLLCDNLPRTDWLHSTGWAKLEDAEDYMIDYKEWWRKGELDFLRAVWENGEVQFDLVNFIATKTTAGAAKITDDTCVGGRHTLIGLKRVKRLAGKISRRFEKERTRQTKAD
jgi:tetratricopeptide (TPR) repeat protein